MTLNLGKTKYLIIGNSAGGIGAAEAIRQVDKEGSLTLVSDEPYPAYSRPLISKYLAGECTLEGMLFRPADFYRRHHLNLLFKKVKRLHPRARVAELASGEEIAWEKLLLAVGGVPVVPQVEGIARRGVFTFTTLEEAKAIDLFLKNGQKAVVVGGGLIGISVTEALVKRKVKVTVVEMKKYILSTVLDRQASLLVEETLRQEGVRLITGHTAKAITGKVTVKGVVLDSNEEIPCDLVLVAIGVKPRTELVQDAEIEVNQGIVVDRQMATSFPGVYSCGDAAEAYDFIEGGNRVNPIWPGAYLGGKVAGYHMAGASATYPGSTALNSLNYFGLGLVAAGKVTPEAEGTYEVLCRRDNGAYRKIVLKDNQVVGMVFAGEIERAGIIFNLMKEGINVESFKQALLADDFGLAFLPRELFSRSFSSLKVNVKAGS